MSLEAPVRIRRALLSVSDKTDLVPFARALAAAGVELVSTGGTAAALAAAGLEVTPIERLTGFPEMLDGRVKTLHPTVHGGLLFRRDRPDHVEAARAHGIGPIDLVCVNLYPFERTVRQPDITPEEAIEQIDIGGPAMVRSAAKNFASVAVVTAASQYDRVVTELAQHDGQLGLALRRELAAAAFTRTAAYDAAISGWMDAYAGGGSAPRFPQVLHLHALQREELRYGENPHQRAAVYADPSPSATLEANAVGAELRSGKPLSYNNLLDASAAIELVQDLRELFPGRIAATVVKHTNPCGAAVADDARAAFAAALEGDPLAAYGGIVAISGPVDAAAAEAMVSAGTFLEVVAAERFEPEAERLLADRWKNVRLLATGPFRPVAGRPLAIRSVPGGYLLQERDTHPTRPADFRRAAGPEIAADTLADAAFLFTVAKHLKSNAVCVGFGLRLLGAGAGQMDRVAACRNAIEKAGERLRTPGATPVAASDAFFPFADGPALLLDAGVRCLVHPGGSKRDEDTFALCAERGATCLLTGTRHFRH